MQFILSMTVEKYLFNLSTTICYSIALKCLREGGQFSIGNMRLSSTLKRP